MRHEESGVAQNDAATVPDEVQLIVDALDDKRAKDIVVLDLTEVSDSLDWFIVATGESSLQLKALEDGVRERLKSEGHLPRAVEGPSTRWVLVDYGFVVAHLMSPEARDFYDLEGLWADAARVAVTPR
jgi:ribosome-associated protein